jgi:hypothetical protein
MNSHPVSPLGVCLLPSPAPNQARTISYPEAMHEILQHAGVCYDSFPVEELAKRLPALRILLTVGEQKLSRAMLRQLLGWVEAGGAWVSVGGLCGADDKFGVEAEPPVFSSWGGSPGVLGEGYLQPDGWDHPVLQGVRQPLHFFNGIPVRSKRANVLAYVRDTHDRLTPRVALAEAGVGKGRCLLIAPDLPGAVVRIRQGVAVTRDGVPAPDGSAPIADGVLKSDDGAVLDWDFDRRPVPGVPGLSAFTEPIADAWCELLIRAILYLASETGTPLPLLWYYPRNLPALGHLSHDTDLNDPKRAYLLLKTLKDARVHSTWCVILPGYSADLIQQIKDEGHELAMHYDAMSDGTVWSEEAFDRQWRGLTELFGGERPQTNKNHYLRWEGDIEFLEWCGRRGIQLDQSKGVSKTGEAGYNFGSCHPYLSFAMDGTRIDVLELPTVTQDFIVFIPEAFFETLLKGALRVHGILHLLFHPAHMDKAGVAESLKNSVRRGTEAGLEWWTAARINNWERARRAFHWTGYAKEGADERFTFRPGQPMKDATIMCLCPSGKTLEGYELEGYEKVETVMHWGFRFQAMVADLEQGHEYSFACVDEN